ncbi:hypothetical protein D3C85_692150 [compost metagenome]
MHLGPELADLHQGMGPVVEHLDVADDVAKAQDQAAGDDGGQQGHEDLRQVGDAALQRVHVVAGRLLGSILAGAAHPYLLGERLVPLIHLVADHHLELAALGEAALHRGYGLDGLGVGLGRVGQHEPESGQAVADGGDVVLAADPFDQLCQMLCVDF